MIGTEMMVVLGFVIGCIFFAITCVSLVTGLVFLLQLRRAYKRMIRSTVPHPPVEFYYGNARKLIKKGLTKCHLKWSTESSNRLFYSIYFGKTRHIVVSDLKVLETAYEQKQLNTKIIHCDPKLLKCGASFGTMCPVNISWFLLKPTEKLTKHEPSSSTSIEYRSVCADIQHSIVSRYEMMCNQLLEEITNHARLKASANVSRIFDRFALQASMSLFLGKTLRLIEGQSDELSNEIMKTSYLTGTNPNLTSLSILSSNLSTFERLLKFATKRNKDWKDISYIYRLFSRIVKRRRFYYKALSYDDLLNSVLKTHIEDDADEFCQTWFGIFLSNYLLMRNVLVYTTHLLATHPAKQKKLTKLINNFYVYNEEASVHQVAHSVEYLDCVILESIRLYSPNAWSSMFCTDSVTLNNVEFPQGSSVVVPIQAIHRSPIYWQDPNVFNPERFTGHNAASVADGSPFVCLEEENDLSFIKHECTYIGIKMALTCILTYFHFSSDETTVVPLQTGAHRIFGNIQIPLSSISVNIETN